MENSSRVIELTVLSGEDLRINRRSIKNKEFAFVQLQTDGFNYGTTKVDESGGSYPTWNEKLVFELPMYARSVNLQVQCKGSNSGNHNNNNINNNNNISVGFVKIPVSDFIGGYVPENHLHFLSYRLRDAKGEKNGIINVSVRAKATASNFSSTKATLNLQGYATACSSPVGFGGPVAGVVTGVPLWCANRA